VCDQSRSIRTVEVAKLGVEPQEVLPSEAEPAGSVLLRADHYAGDANYIGRALRLDCPARVFVRLRVRTLRTAYRRPALIVTHLQLA
jgi:hypothetical protein